MDDAHHRLVARVRDGTGLPPADAEAALVLCMVMLAVRTPLAVRRRMAPRLPEPEREVLLAPRPRWRIGIEDLVVLVADAAGTTRSGARAAVQALLAEVADALGRPADEPLPAEIAAAMTA